MAFFSFFSNIYSMQSRSQGPRFSCPVLAPCTLPALASSSLEMNRVKMTTAGKPKAITSSPKTIYNSNNNTILCSNNVIMSIFCNKIDNVKSFVGDVNYDVND